VLQLTSARDLGAMTDEDLFWQLSRGQVLDPATTFEEWQAQRNGAPEPPTDKGEPSMVPPEGMPPADKMNGDAA
jgi:hypothetical protein